MAELTIPEKLKKLYELQLVDSEIDEIEVLKGELPMEVRDLEDEITGLETRIGRIGDGIRDIETIIGKHNSNIAEAKTLIERYTKQLDDVKNNREFEALTKEIEMQNLEIQLSEKKIRQTEAELNTKKETLDSTVERKDKKVEALADKKVELEKIIEKTTKTEEKLKRKSERLKKKIEDRLLRAYTRFRSSYKNGLAVVQISRDSCGGCFNEIPPQVQLEIGQRTKIITCEHCGRVIVDDYILEVGKKVKVEEESKAEA